MMIGTSVLALVPSLMLLGIGFRPARIRVRRLPLTGLRSTARSSISTNDSHRPGEGDVISSNQSKTIKALVGLLAHRKKRRELGETVVEGPRMVMDLLKNPATRGLVQQVVVSNSKWDAYAPMLHDALSSLSSQQKDADPSDANRARAASHLPFQLIQATPQVLDACTDTVTHQGIVARVRIPSWPAPNNDVDDPEGDASSGPVSPPLPPPRHSFYLVLDGLQDPGNVGTLVRSCVATGTAGVFVLPPSADVWGPKSLRSAMGATFLLPIYSVTSWDECLDALRTLGCRRVLAATMRDDASPADEETDSAPPPPMSVPHYQVDWTGAPVALVIGGEGSGLSGEVRRALQESPDFVRAVHVPMCAGIESLNAGVCGSVILFEYLRQRHAVSAATTAAAATIAPRSN